jgi:hypothetical protein
MNRRVAFISSACVLAMFLQSTACAATLTQETQNAFMKLVRSPEQPSPREVAKALHVTLEPPIQGETFLGSMSARFAYPLKPNHQGIRSISLFYTIDQSGIRESSELLDIQLDPAVCIDPNRFPASVKFTHRNNPGIPGGDVNTRNLIDYIAPHGNVRSSFILTTPENEHCANKATFFAGYGKDLYRKDDSLDAPEGPLMDATSIGRETLLPHPLHPPFASVTFWNTLRRLVQSGHGYITADQLDMAFLTGLHITQPTGKQSVTRVLRGRVDWYLPLRYSAYGPDLSADSRNTAGPTSYVSIELTTYTFRDERGRPDCLSARHVEEDLLADG